MANTVTLDAAAKKTLLRKIPHGVFICGVAEGDQVNGFTASWVTQGSFEPPLVVMAAIPFSLVGILPAHWGMGAFFTATSMIGFMAGAGIVVRNSIILVDFIELRRAEGRPLRDAVVEAGAVRFRPMLLTALAVVVGAAVIAGDPVAAQAASGAADRFYERSFVLAANERCGLFQPQLTAALSASTWQARGAALRAGAARASPTEVGRGFSVRVPRCRARSCVSAETPRARKERSGRATSSWTLTQFPRASRLGAGEASRIRTSTWG
jgi:hypothetical protein